MCNSPAPIATCAFRAPGADRIVPVPGGCGPDGGLWTDRTGAESAAGLGEGSSGGLQALRPGGVGPLGHPTGLGAPLDSRA